MIPLRKYAAAATLLFPLVDYGSTDLETAATFAAGDVQISKDEGAFANTSNLPAHEGNGIYSLALTATEMQAARISIVIVDQTGPRVWEDQVVLLETYGNASAQHAFDLDQAAQDVNVQSMDADALDASAVAQAAAQKIADELLQRAISNVEPGAGFRTLYGAIASLVNRARINASGNLEVYKTDDSTILETMTATTDEQQNPITELDPP